MSLTNCKTESPQEALATFEKAAIWNHITSGLPQADDMRIKAVKDYETAKAEMLTWLRFIP